MSLVVTRTPYRISFFGGGTDYPAWYREEGGQVVSTTIDKYCYVTCRFFPDFFPPQHRVVYSSIEVIASIADVRHPVVREALVSLGFDDSRGLEINHHGDLPARSGVGSSSAFAVGLLRALATLKGEDLADRALFERAIDLEQNLIGDHVGSQDQVAVCLGGLNHIRFGPGDAIAATPLEIAPERLQALSGRLMLFFLGRQRVASDIAGEIIAAIGHHRAELQAMHRHVDNAVSILTDGRDLDDFGRLLDETWAYKRQLASGVSNSFVDEVYAEARRNGALGGKLSGAGGTGFMLFYVPPERQADVAQAMARFRHVPFEMAADGCQVLIDET